MLLSLTNAILLHDSLDVLSHTAGPDDGEAALLGEVHHGGAQPGLLGVAQPPPVTHELEAGVEVRELLHGQGAPVIAQVSRGQGQGAATQSAHLSEETVIRNPHSDQVCVRVKLVVELLRPLEHQRHLARQQRLNHLSRHRHIGPAVNILHLRHANCDGLLGVSTLKEC